MVHSYFTSVAYLTTAGASNLVWLLTCAAGTLKTTQFSSAYGTQFGAFVTV